MRDTARGSYAAHNILSRYDNGPTGGFSVSDRERIGLGWWLAFLVPLAMVAVALVVHHAR